MRDYNSPALSTICELSFSEFPLVTFLPVRETRKTTLHRRQPNVKVNGRVTLGNLLSLANAQVAI